MWWIIAGIIACIAIGIGMRGNEGDLTSDQAGGLLIGLIAVAILIFIGALLW